MQNASEGEAWLIQDVPVAKRALWQMILDFDRYPEQVEAISETRWVDQVATETGRLIRIDYRVSALFFTFQYHLAHDYRPARDYLRWTLDPAAENDFKQVEGYWLLTDHPQRAGWSRVYYGARLTVADWLPAFLTQRLALLGLDSTSQWLDDAETFIQPQE